MYVLAAILILVGSLGSAIGEISKLNCRKSCDIGSAQPQVKSKYINLPFIAVNRAAAKLLLVTLAICLVFANWDAVIWAGGLVAALLLLKMIVTDSVKQGIQQATTSTN